jgi:hypothetical protein
MMREERATDGEDFAEQPEISEGIHADCIRSLRWAPRAQTHRLWEEQLR